MAREYIYLSWEVLNNLSTSHKTMYIEVHEHIHVLAKEGVLPKNKSNPFFLDI